MDTRLVYGQQPKIESTDNTYSNVEFIWCGMLRDEDENGTSLTPLMQYQFEPAQLEHELLEEAKKLNLLFVWQKFQMNDMEFKRLLFVDYNTELRRTDYPSLGDNGGVYYDVGEALPYTAIEPHTNNMVFFNDGAARGHPIVDVLLDMSDAKYNTNEFKNIFSKITAPYQEWIAEETQQYHESLLHQSYTHELFDDSAEWLYQVNTWLGSINNDDMIANSEAVYKSYLKRQTDRIVDELTRILLKNKDEQTIDQFIKQIDNIAAQVHDLHDKTRSTAKLSRKLQATMLEDTKYSYEDLSAQIDEIIFDLDVSDLVENKLVLQELFTLMLNISEGKTDLDISLQLNENWSDNKNSTATLPSVRLEYLPLTEHQCFIICKMCLYYFRGLLEEKMITTDNTSAFDSYELNLIEFAAYAFVISFSSMLAFAQS